MNPEEIANIASVLHRESRSAAVNGTTSAKLQRSFPNEKSFSKDEAADLGQTIRKCREEAKNSCKRAYAAKQEILGVKGISSKLTLSLIADHFLDLYTADELKTNFGEAASSARSLDRVINLIELEAGADVRGGNLIYKDKQQFSHIVYFVGETLFNIAKAKRPGDNGLFAPPDAKLVAEIFLQSFKNENIRLLGKYAVSKKQLKALKLIDSAYASWASSRKLKSLVQMVDGFEPAKYASKRNYADLIKPVFDEIEDYQNKVKQIRDVVYKTRSSIERGIHDCEARKDAEEKLLPKLEKNKSLAVEIDDMVLVDLLFGLETEVRGKIGEYKKEFAENSAAIGLHKLTLEVIKTNLTGFFEKSQGDIRSRIKEFIGYNTQIDEIRGGCEKFKKDSAFAAVLGDLDSLINNARKLNADERKKGMALLREPIHLLFDRGSEIEGKTHAEIQQIESVWVELGEKLELLGMFNPTIARSYESKLERLGNKIDSYNKRVAKLDDLVSDAKTMGGEVEEQFRSLEPSLGIDFVRSYSKQSSRIEKCREKFEPYASDEFLKERIAGGLSALSSAETRLSDRLDDVKTLGKSEYGRIRDYFSSLSIRTLQARDAAVAEESRVRSLFPVFIYLQIGNIGELEFLLKKTPEEVKKYEELAKSRAIEMGLFFKDAVETKNCVDSLQKIKDSIANSSDLVLKQDFDSIFGRMDVIRGYAQDESLKAAVADCQKKCDLLEAEFNRTASRAINDVVASRAKFFAELPEAATLVCDSSKISLGKNLLAGMRRDLGIYQNSAVFSEPYLSKDAFSLIAMADSVIESSTSAFNERLELAKTQLAGELEKVREYSEMCSIETADDLEKAVKLESQFDAVLPSMKLTGIVSQEESDLLLNEIARKKSVCYSMHTARLRESIKCYHFAKLLESQVLGYFKQFDLEGFVELKGQINGLALWTDEIYQYAKGEIPGESASEGGADENAEKTMFEKIRGRMDSINSVSSFIRQKCGSLQENLDSRLSKSVSALQDLAEATIAGIPAGDLLKNVEKLHQSDEMLRGNEPRLVILRDSGILGNASDTSLASRVEEAVKSTKSAYDAIRAKKESAAKEAESEIEGAKEYSKELVIQKKSVCDKALKRLHEMKQILSQSDYLGIGSRNADISAVISNIEEQIKCYDSLKTARQRVATAHYSEINEISGTIENCFVDMVPEKLADLKSRLAGLSKKRDEIAKFAEDEALAEGIRIVSNDFDRINTDFNQCVAGEVFYCTNGCELMSAEIDRNRHDTSQETAKLGKVETVLADLDNNYGILLKAGLVEDRSLCDKVAQLRGSIGSARRAYAEKAALCASLLSESSRMIDSSFELARLYSDSKTDYEGGKAEWEKVRRLADSLVSLSENLNTAKNNTAEFKLDDAFKDHKFYASLDEAGRAYESSLNQFAVSITSGISKLSQKVSEMPFTTIDEVEETPPMKEYLGCAVYACGRIPGSGSETLLKAKGDCASLAKKIISDIDSKTKAYDTLKASNIAAITKTTRALGLIPTEYLANLNANLEGIDSLSQCIRAYCSACSPVVELDKHRKDRALKELFNRMDVMRICEREKIESAYHYLREKFNEISNVVDAEQGSIKKSGIGMRLWNWANGNSKKLETAKNDAMQRISELDKVYNREVLLKYRSPEKTAPVKKTGETDLAHALNEAQEMLDKFGAT